MNETMYDILETCLAKLEQGEDLENLLAQYPQFAAELRPLLKTAQAAQRFAASPSVESMRRGRARLMQKTEELREARFTPRPKRPALAFLPKLAYALAALLLFFSSGAGLLNASASSLPGETLYPVKRGAENLQIAFSFNSSAKKSLQKEYNYIRLYEVQALLAEGKRAAVKFSGVLNGDESAWFVANIPVSFSQNSNLPPVGQPLFIYGWTNENGLVDVESFSALLNDSSVPTLQNNAPMPLVVPAVEQPAPAAAGDASATQTAPKTLESEDEYLQWLNDNGYLEDAPSQKNGDEPKEAPKIKNTPDESDGGDSKDDPATPEPED
ncbi:MAG: hypothetical protein Fur002_02820 [Anaerolineales bacterium]